MNALLNHVWGVSRAQDRVWEQVTGLAPKRAVRRLLMVLQAFIDDSAAPNGTFVLGGYVASAEAWTNFTKEWEEILHFGVRGKDGTHHFHMTEMARLPERMKRVLFFYRVIEANVLCAISCQINIPDIQRAIARISIPDANVAFERFDNPYLFTYRCLMDNWNFHRNKLLKDVISLDDKVEFIFDNRAEKKFIYAGWDDFVENRPNEYRPFYGSHPRFEDDKEFLPLQAADFWAWWVRKWCDEGTPWPDLKRFNPRKTAKPYKIIHLNYSQDSMVKSLVQCLRESIGPGPNIYDRDVLIDKGF